MPRHIVRQEAPDTNPQPASMLIHPGEDWMVIYLDDHAYIHHVHGSSDDHNICGPVLFCCQNAVARFAAQFPENDISRLFRAYAEDAMLQTRLMVKPTPAGQVASWLDAGIQVVNFVFCDLGSSYGLQAAVLSGKEARLALLKEIPLQKYASEASLVGIGSGLDQRN